MFRKRKQNKHIRKKSNIAREHNMLKRQIFIGVTLVLLISLLLTAVWYLTRIASLQISEIAVVGGLTIPHQTIVDAAQQELKGSYFRLVPKSFTYSYPKKSILQHIAHMPRVKHAQLQKESKRKLIIAFEEYTPYALWCENQEADRCLFIDEYGFAFAQAPQLNGSAFIRYSQEGAVPAVKQQAFTKEFIKQTRVFTEKLATELDLYVVGIEKIQDLDVLYTISGGGVLKVSQMMPIEKSFHNLRSILGSKDFVHLQNGKFQYIDLRFGDKIFLNAQQNTTTSSTSDTVTP